MKSSPRIHTIVLALALLLPSLALYGVHYAVFRNVHDIFYYLLMDVAFLFVQALLVTVIIEGLLSVRERRALRKKTKVILSVFFSQVGTPLVRSLALFDAAADGLARQLQVRPNTGPAEFAAMHLAVTAHQSRFEADRGNLAGLRAELLAQRDFLVRLLENPSLLEHELFTELLWSVFHLTDELSQRQNLVDLPEGDRRHLENDIHRAYHLLLPEWLDYLVYLQSDYPYLFSLAVRTSPFSVTPPLEVHAPLVISSPNPN